MRISGVLLWGAVLLLSAGVAFGGELDDTVFQPYSLPGMAAGDGTHIQVTGADSAVIAVDTTEAVRLELQSAGETIMVRLTPLGGAASTRLTLSGLKARATYYLYQDGLQAAQVFAADDAGAYSFDQDIAAPHSLHIFTKHSTLFLTDNETGGDCASIGNWDAATRTCTLTGDVQNSIQITSSGITLDGNGHTISGQGTGYGIYANYLTGLVIRNCTITGFSKGIMFDNEVYSSQILSNTFYGNSYAIEFWRFCRGNVIQGNTIRNNGGWAVHLNLGSNGNLLENNEFRSNNSALYLINAHYNTFRKNLVDQNTWDGVAFYWSCINTIESNTLSHNYYAFNYWGRNWCGQSIFRGNTISDNVVGMYLVAPLNQVYRNNFINNGTQVYNDPNYSGTNFSTQPNVFNLELPTGGNYWSTFDTAEEGCTDSNGDGVCDAPFQFTSGQDNYPFNHLVQLNSAPTANAGPDQSVTYDNAASGAFVTLNGAASSDPDGDALTYTWTWDGGTATGVSPVIRIGAGTTVVTLTVDDGNGATATDTVEVRVLYAFGGFLEPVSLGRTFKLGSTVPVKFRLFDATGARVPSAIAHISLVQVSNNEPLGEVIDGSSNVPDAGTAFRYDPVDGQYIYNLSTGPLQIGSWRIIATLDDGAVSTAEIGIR